MLYCIGTLNVRSVNLGKLEVVKQEMGRVNIGILGINELKWTRVGEFNSDDHYIMRVIDLKKKKKTLNEKSTPHNKRDKP